MKKTYRGSREILHKFLGDYKTKMLLNTPQQIANNNLIVNKTIHL